jgi:hypothetical protein
MNKTMEIFNKLNQRQHKLTEPIVSISKSGTFRFNKSAIQHLSLNNDDTVTIIKKGDSLYMSFTEDVNGLKLNEYGEKKELQFQHKLAANSLIKAINIKAYTVFRTFEKDAYPIEGFLAYKLIPSQIPDKLAKVKA